MPVSANACRLSSGRSRRTARPATCASDSSPVTYSAGKLADIFASACNSRVDLPMPGSPPTSTTAPSTSPPPSTRSNSPMPVLTRASSLWRTSLSAVIFGASALPAQPLRRVAGGPAAASSAIWVSVFQALHSPHCPCHLLNSAPHSLQTYAVLALPIVSPCQTEGAQDTGAGSQGWRRGWRRSIPRKCPVARFAAARPFFRRFSTAEWLVKGAKKQSFGLRSIRIPAKSGMKWLRFCLPLCKRGIEGDLLPPPATMRNPGQRHPGRLSPRPEEPRTE